ncbi:hypothetical protein TNCV_46271 [Trichonephila clavipes]|nr:hypothetical protein TNCV_46271 [Trichonephila clavipes]
MGNVIISSCYLNTLRQEKKPERGKCSKSHLSFRSPQRNMGRITNIDLADMHLIYGLAEENARAAGRLYRERYHHRDAPERRVFTNLHHNLCQYESLRNNEHSEGWLRETRNLQLGTNLLDIVRRNTSTNARAVVEAMVRNACTSLAIVKL